MITPIFPPMAPGKPPDPNSDDDRSWSEIPMLEKILLIVGLVIVIGIVISVIVCVYC